MDEIENKVVAGMEIGSYTFGELLPDPKTGLMINAGQRLHEIVEAGKLADEAGLDVLGIGEHHRLDFAISATPVVMAAVAQATKRLKLASAVTVLSTSDPVKVFEDFATVDLLSDGRAEIIAGRGAFIESFPLFGFDTNDYDDLFPEKLGLLMKLNQAERVTWRGRFRTPLADSQIAPRPAQAQLPIWIGVGGTPESVVRAGTLGLPMMLAIIGGSSAPFVELVNLYREVGSQAGHDLSKLPVGVSTHFHIAKTSQQALDEFYPYYSNYFGYLAKERGRRWQVSRGEYEQAVARPGGLFVGSPQQIIDKIMYQHQLFGHSRFMGQLDMGGQPYAMVAEQLNLLASEVAPVVRRETGKPVN